MDGRVRFQAALEGKQPDIIPMIPGNNNAFLCHFYDVAVHQLLEAPELYAELNVRFVKEFGFDLVRPNVGYIFYGCGPDEAREIAEKIHRIQEFRESLPLLCAS